MLFKGASYSQVETEMTQLKWEALRDSFAVEAIKKLARIDTINIEIDSLKNLLVYTENLDCETELYKIVGATKEQVNDYRNKFEITERRVIERNGTPGEAHSSYFDEITSSNIKCLPEFYDRYIGMSKTIESWEGSQKIVTVSELKGTYTVRSGDHLRQIALKQYGDAEEWTLIWEANKDGVYNAEQISDPEKKKITNPDLIFPNQILYIPQRP